MIIFCKAWSTLSKKLQSCWLLRSVTCDYSWERRVLQTSRVYDLWYFWEIRIGSSSCCRSSICSNKSKPKLLSFWWFYFQNKFDASYCEYWHNGDDHKSPYKASWFTQFRAVLWRSWLSVMKDPFLIKVRLLQIIVINKNWFFQLSLIRFCSF